jgi:uridine kinase
VTRPVDGGAAEAFESISSHKQPTPPPASRARARLVVSVAERVVAIRDGRIRVIVDGLTASGKTSFAHELAAAVRQLRRPTLRASLDDFKKPWRDAREKGYDRVTGEGYYRNPHDFESARTLLIEPAGPEGSGIVVLCAHDPLTGVDRRDTTIHAPGDAVLLADGVFGMRPEYDAYWDLRIWMDVPAALALERGIARDTEMEGADEAERLHRDRFHPGERLYVEEVDPRSRADLVIDNTDFANPVIVR